MAAILNRKWNFHHIEKALNMQELSQNDQELEKWIIFVILSNKTQYLFKKITTSENLLSPEVASTYRGGGNNLGYWFSGRKA